MGQDGGSNLARGLVPKLPAWLERKGEGEYHGRIGKRGEGPADQRSKSYQQHLHGPQVGRMSRGGGSW